MRNGILACLALLIGHGLSPALAAVHDELAPRVEELTLAEALRQFAEGSLTAETLTQAYLDRIEQVDRKGPTLRSVIELNPAALDQARALDAERQAGKLRGPLHGIPVLLKDNIDAVGMATSAGSLALADNRPKRDAFLVARLRAAGMVILGKTNLSEWANFRSTRSTSGWSSRGGQTRNPYVLDRNPCGSSSGTGAAIAASLAMVGVGTETDGSIICPSAVSGLVGMKPTVGLVSRSGIIPISISQDTAGPMARNVAEAAALLNALAGVDPTDPAADKDRPAVDYTLALDAGALKGKRLGLVRQAMGFHPGVDARVEQAVAELRAAGAIVVDVKVPSYSDWNGDELKVLLYEFKDGLNHYLAASGSPRNSLASLIEWNEAHVDTVMPHFGQELFLQAQAMGPVSDSGYQKARKRIRRLARTRGLLAVMKASRLDALVAPSMSPAWLTDPVNGDHFTGAGYGIAAVAGTPSITVPSGEIRGLPIGLVFMGRPYDEAALLGIAYAFEQCTRARRPPRYLSTIPD